MSGPRRRSAAPEILAAALVLVAPVVSFLSYQGYGLLRSETLLLLGGVLALGAGLGGLVAALPWPAPRALALGSLASFALAVMFGALFWVPAALLAGAWLLRAHFGRILAVASAALVASTLIFPDRLELVDVQRQPGALPANRELAPILHVILDEHIGLEGIPTELAAGRRLKRELESFYTERGFRVHSRAYSQYVNSYNAIPNLLNFTSSADEKAHLDRDVTGYPWVLSANASFDHLVDRGYALRIYQSNYMDYCRHAPAEVELCLTYQFNAIKSIEDALLAPVEKAGFIGRSFLRSSRFLRRLRSLYVHRREQALARGWRLPAWPQGMSEVGPIAVLPVLETLRRDLLEDPRGRVFFAHLNFPHNPYVVDAECRVRPRIADWRMRFASSDGGPENTAETRRERYELYFDQIRCQQKLLAALLDDLRRAPPWADGRVILQGDHGSRIFQVPPMAENAERLSQADLRAGYSALFAVRQPGLEPGLEEAPQPLPALLAEVLGPATRPAADSRIFLQRPGASELRPLDPGGLGPAWAGLAAPAGGAVPSRFTAHTAPAPSRN